MKRLLAILSIFLALPAPAAVLETWTETSLRFTNFGEVEASATAVGLATVDGSNVELAFLFGPVLDMGVPVTDPTSSPVTSVILSSVRPTSATVTPGSPVTIPMLGRIDVCLLVSPLPPCFGSYPLPISSTLHLAGMGVGGVLTFGGAGTVRLSVLGAPYTVGTVSVVQRTASGGLSTYTTHGSSSTPNGGLSLVTASQVQALGLGDDHDLSGMFGRMRVQFTPEPGVALLLVAGALGVMVLGRRRDADC